jgi:nicotinamide mononucleotide transporter
MQQIISQFLNDIHQTSWLVFIAVVTGIASVVFSRKENILVYPVGMISTGIFIFLYITHGLYADASVNFYYTVMSIVGWVMWSRKTDGKKALIITGCSKRDWRNSLLFFTGCWIILYLLLSRFTDSTVPVADSFTSAAAFTGMWLMNKKKLENWTWWIITDLASIPLNFYKGLMLFTLMYVLFLVMAWMGYITWKKKATTHEGHRL